MPGPRSLLVFLLAACCVASGCGASGVKPTVGSRHDVAQRFAEAVLHGNAAAAVGLLTDPGDTALASRAAQAAAEWKARPGSVRTPGVASGHGWVFRYSGRHSKKDGRFEDVRGDILVVVAASGGGAGVDFFALLNQRIRFRTHHDSVLLPSDR